jgi:hypothetical protein
MTAASPTGQPHQRIGRMHALHLPTHPTHTPAL